jgi:hypothetical protein
MEGIKDQVDKHKEAWGSVNEGIKSSPAAVASLYHDVGIV